MLGDAYLARIGRHRRQQQRVCRPPYFRGFLLRLDTSQTRTQRHSFPLLLTILITVANRTLPTSASSLPLEQGATSLVSSHDNRSAISSSWYKTFVVVETAITLKYDR